MKKRRLYIVSAVVLTSIILTVIVTVGGRTLSSSSNENSDTPLINKDSDIIIAEINGSLIKENQFNVRKSFLTFSSNGNCTDEEVISAIGKEIIVQNETDKYDVSLSNDSIEEIKLNRRSTYEKNIKNQEIADEAGLTKDEIIEEQTMMEINLINKANLMKKVIPMLLSGEISVESSEISSIISEINNNSGERANLIAKLFDSYINYLYNNSTINIF